MNTPLGRSSSRRGLLRWAALGVAVLAPACAAASHPAGAANQVSCPRSARARATVAKTRAPPSHAVAPLRKSARISGRGHGSSLGKLQGVQPAVHAA